MTITLASVAVVNGSTIASDTAGATHVVGAEGLPCLATAPVTLPNGVVFPVTGSAAETLFPIPPGPDVLDVEIVGGTTETLTPGTAAAIQRSKNL
jgi:hypothetical protein